jgi:hypothetical protein
LSTGVLYKEKDQDEEKKKLRLYERDWTSLKKKKPLGNSRKNKGYTRKNVTTDY